MDLHEESDLLQQHGYSPPFDLRLECKDSEDEGAETRSTSGDDSKLAVWHELDEKKSDLPHKKEEEFSEEARKGCRPPATDFSFQRRVEIETPSNPCSKTIRLPEMFLQQQRGVLSWNRAATHVFRTTYDVSSILSKPPHTDTGQDLASVKSIGFFQPKGDRIGFFNICEDSPVTGYGSTQRGDNGAAMVVPITEIEAVNPSQIVEIVLCIWRPFLLINLEGSWGSIVNTSNFAIKIESWRNLFSIVLTPQLPGRMSLSCHKQTLVLQRLGPTTNVSSKYKDKWKAMGLTHRPKGCAVVQFHSSISVAITDSTNQRINSDCGARQLIQENWKQRRRRRASLCHGQSKCFAGIQYLFNCGEIESNSASSILFKVNEIHKVSCGMFEVLSTWEDEGLDSDDCDKNIVVIFSKNEGFNLGSWDTIIVTTWLMNVRDARNPFIVTTWLMNVRDARNLQGTVDHNRVKVSIKMVLNMVKYGVWIESVKGSSVVFVFNHVGENQGEMLRKAVGWAPCHVKHLWKLVRNLIEYAIGQRVTKKQGLYAELSISLILNSTQGSINYSRSRVEEVVKLEGEPICSLAILSPISGGEKFQFQFVLANRFILLLKNTTEFQWLIAWKTTRFECPWRDGSTFNDQSS